MKYAVEIGSGAMKYVQSFRNFGSANQKLMRGGRGIHGHTDTQTEW
jgi:hypothetical protein